MEDNKKNKKKGLIDGLVSVGPTKSGIKIHNLAHQENPIMEEINKEEVKELETILAEIEDIHDNLLMMENNEFKKVRELTLMEEYGEAAVSRGIYLGVKKSRLVVLTLLLRPKKD